MGRTVALALALLLVLAVLRAVLRRVPKDRPAARRPALATVRCAQCGVFVPPTQALRAGERAYCGERCAQAARGGG